MTSGKRFVAAALLATGFAAPAMAQGTAKGTGGGGVEAGEGVVVVSCYRGPIRQTIWDYPEPVFIDSLVGVGYDYGSAEAIGDRVCRDETLVGDPEALRAEVERLIAAAPADR